MQGSKKAQATNWCLERVREPIRSRGRGEAYSCLQNFVCNSCLENSASSELTQARMSLLLATSPLATALCPLHLQAQSLPCLGQRGGLRFFLDKPTVSRVLPQTVMSALFQSLDMLLSRDLLWELIQKVA